MTKSRLAEEAGVTLRSVTAYESGEMEPSNPTVESLAQVLRFPVGYFSAGEATLPSEESASFRALSTLSASRRDSALAAGGIAIELSRWIDQRFELPRVDIPDFGEVDEETAATKLRAEWELGDRPIPNMLDLLEVHGVRVFSLAEESRAVDAFSWWHDSIPYVFFNTTKSAERGRLDAAHELAHLLLHRNTPNRDRSLEIEANRFAGALLMPASALRMTCPAVPTLANLMPVKKWWGASLMALLTRLHQLDLVSEWHYRSLCVQASERGFRRSEPDGAKREVSQVLGKVLSALREDGVSLRNIASELHVDASEVGGLLFGLAPIGLHGGGSGKKLGSESLSSSPRRSSLRSV